MPAKRSPQTTFQARFSAVAQGMSLTKTEMGTILGTSANSMYRWKDLDDANRGSVAYALLGVLVGPGSDRDAPPALTPDQLATLRALDLAWVLRSRGPLSALARLLNGLVSMGLIQG